MTKKKADKQHVQHLDSNTESIEVSPDHPSEIRRKRRLAKIQAICLLQYLEEQGQVERFILV
jgi:hypothetical protein